MQTGKKEQYVEFTLTKFVQWLRTTQLELAKAQIVLEAAHE